ncbi:nucleoside deaminase [Paenarthrobacter sp. NPDC057355]|uniref:nucleoside deaminase n=1 Tax=Paenarthrobacter sp. NPDC057355 TaxID=3346105 RepID=UPI0036419F81
MSAHSAHQRDEYLNRAIELAVQNVSDGGGPFGAIVVTPDGTAHEGVNRVTRDHDPTAHAEVVAIRRAAAAIRKFDLSGSVLYTSCEPCPLCLSATLWARIGHVYFAADRNGAARAGFDDALFYEYFNGSRPALLPVEHFELPAADQPFEAWRNHVRRTAY